nr:DUF4158 domain-containing protein [Streptomyces sp. SID12488]
MPVELLTDEQATAFGSFADEPTRPELERFFFLDGEARKLIAKRRGGGFHLALLARHSWGQFRSSRYRLHQLGPAEAPWWSRKSTPQPSSGSPGIGRRCALRAPGWTNSLSLDRVKVAAAGLALPILGRTNW